MFTSFKCIGLVFSKISFMEYAISLLDNLEKTEHSQEDEEIIELKNEMKELTEILSKIVTFT